MLYFLSTFDHVLLSVGMYQYAKQLIPFCKQKIKAALAELQPTIEDIDKEYGVLIKKCKKDNSDQIKRVHDKLKEEWNNLNKAYKERHDK